MSNREIKSKKILSHITLYSDGRLYNHKTNKFKTWVKSNNGYVRTQIWENNKSITVSQHRLLAIHFIDNPLNKSQVNHINGIKYDNRIENLEWVTQSENALHSYANGLQKPNKPRMKPVINTLNGNIYESISAASRESGINISNLRRMLLGVSPNKTTFKFYDNK